MDTSLYQARILDHAQHPRHKEELPDPTVSLPAKNSACGDSYIVYLNVEDGIIKNASFTGIGCAISQAAASLLTDMLIGMTVDDARTVTEEKVRTLLGIPLTRNREKCALLVWRGFTEALKKL